MARNKLKYLLTALSHSSLFGVIIIHGNFGKWMFYYPCRFFKLQLNQTLSVRSNGRYSSKIRNVNIFIKIKKLKSIVLSLACKKFKKKGEWILQWWIQNLVVKNLEKIHITSTY